MRSVRRLSPLRILPLLLGLWLPWPTAVWPQSIIATLPVAGSQVAVNSVTHEVYVADSSGTVTVIDGNTDSTATLQVGGSPTAVAVNERTNQIYVANSPGNSVTVIDGATNSLTTVTDPNAMGPNLVAVNEATNKIYVVNSGSLNITVIDGASNSTTTLAPQQPPGGILFEIQSVSMNGIAINSVTNQIYIASSYFHSLPLDNRQACEGIVTVIDGASNTLTYVGTGWCESDIAVNAATNTVFVTGGGNGFNFPPTVGTVAVIDGATNTGTSIQDPKDKDITVAVAVNPTTNKIYVTSAGNVTVIDGATLSTTTVAVASPGTPEPALAVDPTTSTVYVVNGAYNCPGASCNPGSVTVIDGATNATTKLVDPQANAPIAIGIDASTDRIYVANGGSGNLTVIGGDDAVPNVVGGIQSAASAAITGAGLSVGTVMEQSSSTVPAGSVITETPAAGSYAAPGSSVNLVVSTGNPSGGGGGGTFDWLSLGALLSCLSAVLRRSMHGRFRTGPTDGAVLKGCRSPRLPSSEVPGEGRRACQLPSF